MRQQVTPECDGARQGDYCSGGIIRHIQHENFHSTEWLCLKHKKERDQANERKQATRYAG